MCTLAGNATQPRFVRGLLYGIVQVIMRATPRDEARKKMADLEKLALRRDRGYLLRLLLLLAAGIVCSVFLFGWLTGSSVSGCVAGALGADPKAAPKSPSAH
jgi:hypothetical protein